MITDKNLLLAIISTLIFIVSIVINRKYIWLLIKIIVSNFEEDRFILDNKSYTVYGNRKALLKFSLFYVAGFIVFILSFILNILIWIYLRNYQILDLFYSVFTLIFPINISISFSDNYIKKVNEFKEKAISIEKLKSFKSYEECKQYIKSIKYKLTKEDAAELNSYYNKVYRLDNDYFKSWIETLEIGKKDRNTNK